MFCLYCGSEITQRSREHVIPQFFGRFHPINPTINIVCSNCNSRAFSSMENELKEDSREGIISQMLNINNCRSVRIRGNNVNMNYLSGLGDNFFDEFFPFLQVQDSEFAVLLKSQIKIKNYGGEGGYQIFLLDALESYVEGSRDFNITKVRLGNSSQKDIAILTLCENENDQGPLINAIETLSKYGIKYNEKENKGMSLSGLHQKSVSLAREGKISHNICRVVSKIAFNYFAYCCIQNDLEEVLYHVFFNNIKKFIIGLDFNKDEVVYCDRNPILPERISAYIIIFYEENNIVYAKLSFWGWVTYTIKIGDFPDNIVKENFGCGHLFNPFEGTIHQMCNNLQNNIVDNEVSFGLFKN